MWSIVFQWREQRHQALQHCYLDCCSPLKLYISTLHSNYNLYFVCRDLLMLNSWGDICFWPNPNAIQCRKGLKKASWTQPLFDRRKDSCQNLLLCYTDIHDTYQCSIGLFHFFFLLPCMFQLPGTCWWPTLYIASALCSKCFKWFLWFCHDG